MPYQHYLLYSEKMADKKPFMALGSEEVDLLEFKEMKKGVVGHKKDYDSLVEEVTQLKGFVEHQQQIISDLMEELRDIKRQPNLNIPLDVNAKPPSPKSYLKPRDIPLLELSQLHGVETESFLNRFFDRVESCIPEITERVKVAQSRLDIPLANLVKAEMDAYRIHSWESFKKVLQNQFKGSTQISELWRELGEERYEVHDSPRAFANRLVCKYSALTAKFPKETLPDRDQLIKKRLCQGLPRRAQMRLEDFLNSKMDLTTFIDTVEFERSLSLGQEGEGRMFRMSQEKGVEEPTVQNLGVEKKDDKDPQDRWGELQKSLLELTEQMRKINNPPKKPWCGYCRTGDHERFRCPLNPPKGSCFDCMRVGCRKGNPDCPGRGGRPSGTA